MSRAPGLPVRLAIAVSCSSFAAYAATAARTLSWGDSPELVAVAQTLGIAHPPGYPLYTLLGALAVRVPLGDPFFRLSVMSAVFAAAAAGIVALLTWRIVSSVASATASLGGRFACGAASVLAGLAFAFSGALWSQATIPEVYSLAAVLVFWVLLVAVGWYYDDRAHPDVRRRRARDRAPSPSDRRLALLGLLTVLALTHHLTAFFVVPSVGIILFARRRGRPSARALSLALLCGAAGLSLYLYLPIRAAQDPPLLWARVDSLGGLVRHILGAQYASRLFTAPGVQLLHRLKMSAAALPHDMPWAVLALAGVGFWALWRRSRALFAALALYAALVLAHVVGYGIQDPEAYYIPIQGVLSIAAGVGLAALAGIPRRFLAAAVAAVALAALVVHVESHWRERDLRTRVETRVYLQRMLDTIGPGGIVLAHSDGTLFPLWYARFVEGRREDVAVANLREQAPHLARWYPGLRFPSEEELALYLSRTGVLGYGRPLLETVPLSAYVPLFLALNQGARPIYADIEIGRKTCPERSVPRGLVVQILADPIPPSPASFASTERALWDSYLAGIEGAPGGDDRTREQYAMMLNETGSLHLVRGETPSAIEAFERAAALAPWLPQSHNNLGIAYQTEGRFAEAIREFETALAARPGLAETYYNIYAVSARRGDLARAEAALVRAARIDRRYARYALDLAAIYRKIGRPDRAAALLQTLGQGKERS